jgi:hypothetical protein
MEEKMRQRWLCLSVLVIALALALPASAQQILYEDGPINGETDAWTINFGFIISDTFTISTGNSTINGIAFGAWMNQGDILQSAQVTISSQEVGGGTVYFNGFVNFTQTDCFTNNYGFNVCTETGSFANTSLGNGTYWLSLQNAVVNNGDPVYWDENSGIGCHSPGCPSEAGNGSIGTLPAEAFTVFGSSGTTGTVPEPGSFMLIGAGAVAVLGTLRRRLHL